MDINSSPKRKIGEISDNQPSNKKLCLKDCDKKEVLNIHLKEIDKIAIDSTKDNCILSNKLELDHQLYDNDIVDSKSPQKCISVIEDKSTSKVNKFSVQNEIIKKEINSNENRNFKNIVNEDNYDKIAIIEAFSEKQNIEELMLEVGKNINPKNEVIAEEDESDTSKSIENSINKESQNSVTSPQSCQETETIEIDDPNNFNNLNQIVDTDLNQASTTNTLSIIKEKCKYGDKCYRKNTEHKTRFSHPGDPDYDTPDNRQECPYGLKCYRKNQQHKRDYKHIRIKRKAASIAAQQLNSGELLDSDESIAESVDESEYEASFIDDDEDFDYTDSDFEEDDTDGAKCEE